jgi:hypothetical protein
VLDIDIECAITGEDEQVFGVAADDVAQGLEDGSPGAGDAGLQLLGAQVETCIDHSHGCPYVVCERRFENRTAHGDLP